ncbi:hypothetical protein RRG08_021937 [Elysia crispata]|uniref:Uncharacterized protein n=1 Tax=Elysia crispata TaxID=231223 RepID=A0AAE1ACL6_9GAST|nr:hypothetical protein RRG08_021937 [Elysia crispata]
MGIEHSPLCGMGGLAECTPTVRHSTTPGFRRTKIDQSNSSWLGETAKFLHSTLWSSVANFRIIFKSAAIRSKIYA